MNHSSPRPLSMGQGVAFSPEYRGNEDPETPRAVYTTAGTLYNPKAAQSLQPPVRRGRAAKWAPGGPPSSELCLLPKSALASLPLRGMPRGDAEPVPEYSPLQQNTDRAISPSRHRHNIEDSQLEYLDGLDEATLPSFRPRPHTHHRAPPGFDAGVKMEAQNPLAGDGDTSDDKLGRVPLLGFPVKSLHNLASYPNPNQKRARKALLSARRPASGSGTSADNNNTRASTPLFYRPGSDWDGNPKELAAASGSQRQQTSDFDGFYRRNPEARPREVPSPFSIDNTLPTGDVFFDSTNSHAEMPGGYRTMLAQGPGAPKPLTAGPPGIRQHRTTAADLPPRNASGNNARLDNPLLANVPGKDGMANGSQRIRFDGPPPAPMAELRFHYPAPVPPGLEAAREADKATDTSTRLQELRHSSAIEPRGFAHPRRLNSGAHSSSCCIDTLPPESIRKYYPHGLPQMSEVHPISPNWVGERLKEVEEGESKIWKRSAESIQHRNLQVERAFYAGNREVGKSMDFVINEAERQRQQRTVGVIGDRRRVQEEPRKKISVEEANSRPTSEATAPLLALVMSTFLRQADARHSNSQYRQDYFLDSYTTGSRSREAEDQRFPE